MIRRCSGSTARSPRSRSTGQVRSIRSICRSRKSSSNSAQMSKHPTRSRCSCIEGEGRAFCAGGDLQTIGAAAAADNIAPVVGELLQHYHAFITTLRRMPKVVLSSVHGSAAGAGLSLAFVADLCIAAEDARFTPAYSKLGVSPDGGGTVGVAASVGPRRAMQIFLAEDSFSAAQAYEWGLVAKVVPASRIEVGDRRVGAPTGAKRGRPGWRRQRRLSTARTSRQSSSSSTPSATPSSIACTRTISGSRSKSSPAKQNRRRGGLASGRDDGSVGADIPRSGRRLEAADRFRNDMLRQPQHHASENKS